METLKGPFGSSGNFIAMIALPNCVEYLQHHEDGGGDVTNRELTRLLFNAVVALDSVVDYRFFEQASAATSRTTVDELVKKLATDEPAVGEIRELANAMKHCIRGRFNQKSGFVKTEGRTHAADILTTRIDAVIDLESIVVSAEVSSSLLEGAHETVEAAFRYWLPHAT